MLEVTDISVQSNLQSQQFRLTLGVKVAGVLKGLPQHNPAKVWPLQREECGAHLVLVASRNTSENSDHKLSTKWAQIDSETLRHNIHNLQYGQAPIQIPIYVMSTRML